VEFEIVAIELVEVVQRDVVIELGVQADGSLVRPAPGHVLDSIAAATQHEQG